MQIGERAEEDVPMESSRRTLHSRSNIHFVASIACGVVLALACVEGSAASAATCDPPGPPPRFGCSWSLDTCEWVCAVCDPFGIPPRSSCHWDGDLCNWICPGYTSTAVTVQTVNGPTQDAVVYVNLSSLCTATGAGAFCGGRFSVQHGLSRFAKCRAIADAISNDCATTGYAVATDDCPSTATFTVTNSECPGTQFALGISNDSAVFDQTEQPLPDGESETTTGTCAPVAGPVSNLRVDKIASGSDLSLTWDAAANAQMYDVFEDGSANGSFGAIAGSTTYATTELTIPVPPGVEFYLVAGKNETCGVGTER
jgi:hypothetical protein